MSRWLLILAVITACGPKLEGGVDAGGGSIDDQLDGGSTGVHLSPPFAPADLGAQVTQLSTGVMSDRAPATPGDDAINDYVAGRFTAAGLTVTREAFADASGHVTANIIGVRPGLDPTDVIVVGAHHDTLPGLPGANDNASGVVALLAIADSLQASQLQRTVIFVSFGAEEDPGLAEGATYFLHDPANPTAHVVFMVNLSMVGTYTQQSVVYALGAMVSDTAYNLLEPMAEDSDLIWDLGYNDSGSDQVAFCDANIPYTYMWTPDDDCDHDACDTADRIDTQELGEIALFTSDFVGQLANTTADLAAERQQNGCHDQ
jgi:Peptidase family M28